MIIEHIRLKIRDWLNIERMDATLDRHNNDLAFYKEEIRIAGTKYKDLDRRVMQLEEKLRPSDRQRLEQVKSAIDIQISFLNEIYYKMQNEKALNP